MGSIQFVQNTKDAQLSLDGSVLCLCHPKYEPPQVDGKTLSFPVFHERYKHERELFDVDNIVFVGTNRIITPSNRTDPVFEVLFSGTQMNKVSVDNVPFISQPWRTWFHFGIVNEPYGRYGYSYAAETDYNKWMDDYSEYNPFSLDEMLTFSRGIAMSDYDAYFTGYDVVEVQLMPGVLAEYKDLKDKLLNEEPNITGVLRKLSQFARSVCPQRKVPQPHAIFNKPHGLHIIKTNLGIDDYLVSQLLETIELINDYLRELHG